MSSSFLLLLNLCLVTFINWYCNHVRFAVCYFYLAPPPPHTHTHTPFDFISITFRDGLYEMSVQQLHRDVHSYHPNHAIIRRVDSVWPDKK